MWSGKSWKNFQVISSVQGEASTGWHQELPKSGSISVLCLGLPWWGQPWALPQPLSGVSPGWDTHRTSVAIKLSMGADCPQSCLGGREGHSLCPDQRHASFYIQGFAKLEFISLPQPLPWMLHPHFSHGWLIVKTRCFFSRSFSLLCIRNSWTSALTSGFSGDGESTPQYASVHELAHICTYALYIFEFLFCPFHSFSFQFLLFIAFGFDFSFSFFLFF